MAASVEDIERLIERLSPREQEELRKTIKGEPIIWSPKSKPQAAAVDSTAQQILYGGAVGGGKSDWLIGMALTRHKKSLILRREYEQLTGPGGLIERSKEILLGTGASYNGSEHWWRNIPGGRTIKFGGCKQEDDVRKYQGKDRTFIGLDEGEQFSESQVIFLETWNRSTTGAKSQLGVATNPPASSTGEWIIEWWKPWVDPDHPNRAKPGEIRWFIRLDNKQIEVDGPGKYEGVDAISRTFFPAMVTDNPYLAKDEEYIARLNNLPTELKEIFLYGNFLAGRKEDIFQAIPNAAIKAAQERWEPRRATHGSQTAIGVDPAYGGDDNTAIADRYDTWFDIPEVVPGKQTPTGKHTAQIVIRHVRDNPTIAVDMIGYGAAAYEHLIDLYSKDLVRGINSGESAKDDKGNPLTDRSGRLRFVNYRSWMWWKMREDLTEPDTDYALPDDPELVRELKAPRYSIVGGKIKVEEKKDVRKRLGRSTDRADAVLQANAVDGIPKYPFFFAAVDANPKRQSAPDESKRPKGITINKRKV